MFKKSTDGGTLDKEAFLESAVSFVVSILIGVLFVYLFCWKSVGVSYPIFSMIYLTLSIISFVILKRRQAISQMSNWLIAVPIAFILSLVFIYRLSQPGLIWAGLLIPLTQMIVLVGIFKKEMYSNSNIFLFVIVPVLFFISWIGDFFRFIKSLIGATRFFVGSKQVVTRNIIRVLLGLAVSVPLLMVFGVLFASADEIFATEMLDVLRSIFGDIFASRENFMEFIGKLIVGGIVSIYTMVYFFSLWNKDSLLGKMSKKRLDSKFNDLKKSFNPVVVSTILFSLNILFLVFVFVQFKYLFGGEEKVLTRDNGFTYSEYARRGFSELMVISILSFFLIAFFSMKTYANSLLSKIVYKGNLFLFISSVFVIIASAFTRMWLYESVYGFTSNRLLVNVCIILIGIMYLLLVISMWVKNQWKFLNAATTVMILISLLCIPLIPYDLIAVKLNYSRYLREGKIDMRYLVTQSDEIVPTLVQMRDDKAVSDEVKLVIEMDLARRYDKMKESRKKWQSFHLLHQYGLDKLGDDYKDVERDYKAELADSLRRFIEDYSRELQEGSYERAYEQYWMTNSLPNESFDQLEQIEIIKYEIDEERILTTIDERVDDYFYYPYYYSTSSIYISINLEYTVKRGSRGDVYSLNYTNTHSRRDRLNIIMENGEWKIRSSGTLPIGNFVDGDISKGRVFKEANIDYQTNFDALFIEPDCTEEIY